MNRNVMIVLAGGFLIAVLVALLVQASLSGGKKQPEVAVVKEEPKVEIVVTAVALKVGEELTEQNVKWQSWPKNAVFPGAYVRKADEKATDAVEGKVRRAMVAGEPVVESALVPKKGAFMSAQLGKGMRAVAIDVKPAAMASGFIAPGDRVDVILTYKDKVRYDGDDPKMKNFIDNTIDSFATETILENVKVLAVDQSTTKPEDVAAKLGKTVTLEVDRRGAEVIVLAASMGELSLSLRQLGDEEIVGYKYPVVTDARLTNVYDEVLGELNKEQKTTSQNSNLVRIYNGGDMQEVSVASPLSNSAVPAAPPPGAAAP